MNSNNNRAWIIGIVALALIGGILLGSSIKNTPQAKANGVTDFLSNLLTPFTGNSSTTASATLYQPTVNYEQSVVRAVKQASPAVVSIVISQQVPVVENCPYNPFQNLPPEFQQFFGNGDGSGGAGGGTGLTQPCDTGKTTLQEVGGGSGFIISSDGLILTNKHVVSDTTASYTVITSDGKKYDAKVLARDPVQDLAVVKITGASSAGGAGGSSSAGMGNFPTVTLGDSGGVQLGQSAIAIGNALGEFSNTVSVGVISGLARTVTAGDQANGAQETIQGVLQTDAAINPGNSGGPLLNLEGQVIGINTAIASDAQNIGFAIPINRAKNDINSVKSTGQIQTPYLGVRYTMITADMATAQKLAVSNGALVRGSDTGPAVAPNSPAAKAGIQAEDIIEKVNSQQLDANHDLATTISQYTVGTTVTLTINRGGKEITVQVTLAQRPAGQ